MEFVIWKFILFSFFSVGKGLSVMLLLAFFQLIFCRMTMAIQHFKMMLTFQFNEKLLVFIDKNKHILQNDEHIIIEKSRAEGEYYRAKKLRRIEIVMILVLIGIKYKTNFQFHKSTMLNGSLKTNSKWLAHLN